MYEPEKELPSDDERLTERYERMQRSREYDDYETRNDGVECSECGRYCHYSMDEGGMICPVHGLQ